MFGKLVGETVGTGIAQPIKEVGNILDKLFTSDDERNKAEIAKLEIEKTLLMGQIQTNQQEAVHRSIFVAGWRPAIGWTCAIGLFYDVLLRPIAVGFGYPFPSLDTASLISLIVALLGLGTLRTTEKFGNKTK